MGYLILTANLYYFKKLPESFSSVKLKYYFAHYLGYMTLNLMPCESTTYTTMLQRMQRNTQQITYYGQSVCLS